MIFKNEAQLKNFLLQKCESAIANVQKDVYKTFDEKLNRFYDEFYPDMYERTGMLNSSLTATEPINSGDSVDADVWFDAGCMDYNTGTWSGEEVLNVAMEHSYPHGAYASGTAIWTSGMNELGDIKQKTVEALKAKGVPVK